jgi:hypothetical protein
VDHVDQFVLHPHLNVLEFLHVLGAINLWLVFLLDLLRLDLDVRAFN